MLDYVCHERVNTVDRHNLAFILSLDKIDSGMAHLRAEFDDIG